MLGRQAILTDGLPAGAQASQLPFLRLLEYRAAGYRGYVGLAWRETVAGLAIMGLAALRLVDRG
jgi:hypothetical protein